MASKRIGTTSNLQTGGTYDLLVVKVDGIFPEGKVTFGLYDVPMKTTGLQKVAQIFMKVLFSTKGSDPFYPQRGTYFPSLAVGANIQTNYSTLLSDVTEAVSDATEQVKAYLNVNSADLSSTLDTAEVLGIDKLQEGFQIYIQLKTLAGEFASVALPFPEFGLTA